jgi:hypothetical protein
MKKYFTAVSVFLFILLVNNTWAYASRPITELFNKKYEIKSSMIPPMGGAIIYILQKKNMAYMCIQNLKKGGKTMCDPVE